MSKSGSPKDKNVTKPKPTKRDKGVGVGGSSPAADSGIQNETSDQKCLLDFTTTVTVGRDGLRPGTAVTLLQNVTDTQKLEVIQNGVTYGQYTGPAKATMLQCMKSGYTYEGQVLQVRGNQVRIEVRGVGA